MLVDDVDESPAAAADADGLDSAPDFVVAAESPIAGRAGGGGGGASQWAVVRNIGSIVDSTMV